MPTKSSEGKSASESSKKKTKSPPSYPDQRLDEINVTRARVIASGLGISNPGKHVKDDLIPLIREKLALITDCAGCGGGPCLPDDHVFPASNGGQNSGDESDTSRSGDSPSREHLRALNNTTHSSDVTVPGFESRTSFAQHVTDQILTEEHPPGPSHRVPASPFSPSPEEIIPSDDDDELDADLQAQLKAQQEQLDLEFNTANNAITQKQKEAEAAAAARRKEEQREARRAAKLKQQMDEQLRLHQERMKELQTRAAPPIRGSRNSSRSNDDVFTDVPTDSSRNSRARTSPRVSFPRTSPPRSESARPASDRFHPEYTGDSRRPPSRSRSTGSSLEVDLLAELMDRHSESQAMMASAIEKLANAGAAAGRVHVSELGGFAGQDGAAGHCHKSSSASGTLQLIKPGNPDMARELGVNPRLNWGVSGDMNNVDISKLKKMNLVSGKNRTNEGLVMQQHYWPHDCVSRACLHLLPPKFNFSKLKHDDLTFAMFQEGMTQKILMDSANLDTVVKNKLKFQSKLIRMAYTLPWSDILSIAEQFFGAFEYNQASWDDWSQIESFLKEAYDQARMSSFLRPGIVPGASNAAPVPGSGAAPKGPRKEKKWVDNANGVPWKYMRENSICGGYNIGSCERKGDHKIGSDTVNHWCAGCHGTSKGVTKQVHRAIDCPKGPFDSSLFG